MRPSCVSRTSRSRRSPRRTRPISWLGLAVASSSRSRVGRLPRRKGLSRHVDLHMKHSTKVSYRSTVEVHLLPFFGKMLLTEIRASDIAAFQRHLSTGKRSLKTVRNVVAVLTAALRVAVDRDLIDSVPNVRRVKVPEPDFRFLRREEMRALLETANDTWESAFRFALLSGLRLGEVRALRFEQVNFDTGEVFVDRACGGRSRAPPSMERSGPLRCRRPPSPVSTGRGDRARVWSSQQ